jgi:hypothetical protein
LFEDPLTANPLEERWLAGFEVDLKLENHIIPFSLEAHIKE